MSGRRLLLVSAALLFLLSSGAAAQQCTPDDTPILCWRRFNSVKAKAADKVAKTNTGTPTATTLATATALRDFLSFFAAGVDTGKVTENGTSVTLDWNVPFPFVEDGDRIKVQALFSDSSLAEDVQTPLGSKSNAAKDKLTNFDDITTLISYSPVNRLFGRSIAPHALFLDDLEKFNDGAFDVAAFAQRLAAALEKLKTVPATFRKDSPFSTITDAAEQRVVIQLVEAAAAAEREAAARSSSIVKALTRLINNQPQAYVSGTYHYRNPLVGPDEWSVKATFEVAPKSLNRFLGSNAAFCSEEPTDAKETNGAECVRRLISFAGAEDPSRQPDAGDRLSFAIEYKQAKGESVDLSDFMIATPVARKRTHSFVYSLTYGYPLTGATFKNARFDVAVNYHDVSNDPKKKDRFVASLTFSQKISDTMTLPLSVTYANHTEYLPQTDRRLGVHFGISYKIPDSSGK
jgi:hypothetical protein